MKLVKIVITGMLLAFMANNCHSATKTEQSSGFAFDPGHRGTLLLKIHGMDTAKGNFMIVVIPQNKSGLTRFPYEKTAVVSLIVPAGEKITEVVIPDLPFGRYAIAVIHDTNRNQKMDFILGFDPSIGGVLIPVLPNWPREGYGFSRQKFSLGSILVPGAPGFEKASFEFRENLQSEEIGVSYFWRRWGILYVGSIVALLGSL